MKNLFVSFKCDEGFDNICLSSPSKIIDKDDITSIQEYIEMAYGLQNVTLINWRRME